jgi:hypothetical protein
MNDVFRRSAFRIPSRLKPAVLAAALALTGASPAFADCHNVSGRFVEYVADTFLSTPDPWGFGRVVNFANGTINSVGTAVLTSVFPGPGGPPNWGATTRHVFVESESDQLAATGVAAFTPIPGNTTDVNDTLTLTINGTDAFGTATSLGKYAGATGTIVATGIGFNFFKPFPIPGPTAGSAQFVFHYTGQVCTP